MYRAATRRRARGREWLVGRRVGLVIANVDRTPRLAEALLALLTDQIGRHWRRKVVGMDAGEIRI
jgi:hypothetical protein